MTEVTMENLTMRLNSGDRMSSTSTIMSRSLIQRPNISSQNSWGALNDQLKSIYSRSSDL